MDGTSIPVIVIKSSMSHQGMLCTPQIGHFDSGVRIASTVETMILYSDGLLI
jgi:hypothetical protein